MRETLTLTPADRVLIVAPHPDDESIATGGLIQAVCAVGARLRVLVLTDGDANIWPQRWIEKRWRIDASARARWGARRRAEAIAAMAILGLSEQDAVFLGLPDLGLTDLLMRSDVDTANHLRRVIGEFIPSHVVLPSLADRHPDHSAAHVLMRMALRASGSAFPRLWSFAVHGGTPEGATAVCALSTPQRERKRSAILAHATQMRLGRRRFLRHAEADETFHQCAPRPAALPQHPVHAVADMAGRLRVEIDLPRWRSRLRGHDLFIAMDGAAPARLRIPAGVDEPIVQDTTTGIAAGIVRVEPGRDRVAFVLDTCCLGWDEGFVKLARPQPGLWLFDQFGWQAVMRA
ncbi:MAG: PIG-L deacetylase family protein [Rudaea sp.]